MELLQSEHKLCDMCHKKWTKLKVIGQYCYKCQKRHAFGRYICLDCQKGLKPNKA